MIEVFMDDKSYNLAHEMLKVLQSDSCNPDSNTNKIAEALTNLNKAVDCFEALEDSQAAEALVSIIEKIASKE